MEIISSEIVSISKDVTEGDPDGYWENNWTSEEAAPMLMVFIQQILE